MPLFKQKELHSIVFGLTVHKPDVNETAILASATLILMLVLNKLFPMPLAWFVVGVVGLTASVFDLIPSKNKISAVLCGLAIGVTAAQFNFLIIH